MKIIITESQHNFLVEQLPEPGDKGYEVKKTTKVQQKRSDDAAEEGGFKNEPTNVSINGFYNPKDKHTLLTIAQIGTAFIPVVGPFLSAGIGFADAAQYYQEGDTKTAGLTAMFSMLPLVGKIPGVKQLGAKGLSLLASKLGKGITKFTPLEQQVIAGINANEQLVKTGLNNQIKQTAQKSLISKVGGTSKNILTKVAKGGLKFAGATAPYVAADVAYNKIYDKFNPQKQMVNFDEIDVNKISDVNKQAALNVKF